jgi:hypothetical protein
VVVADFNQNGRADLAIADEGPSGDVNGSIWVLLGKGDGTFTAPTSYTSASTASYSDVAVADLNGDQGRSLPPSR